MKNDTAVAAIVFAYPKSDLLPRCFIMLYSCGGELKIRQGDFQNDIPQGY
jgi:iron-sulfur cluster repair protein YtfE (RIC family)